MKREEIIEYLKTITKDEFDAICFTVKALERESKIGKWIEHDTGHCTYYACSLCNCVAPSVEFADAIRWKLSKYCPDCGAKMFNSQVNTESEDI